MTCSNLVQLLQTRAQQQPNHIAYTFLKNGKTPTSFRRVRYAGMKVKCLYPHVIP